MRSWVAVLILAAGFAQDASAANVRFRLGLNADNVISTAFPCVVADRSDCAPPTTETLDCDGSSSPSLTGLTTGGSSYSENARSPLTGSAAGTCTLSLSTISGDDAASKGWGFSGNNLTNSLTNPGSVGSGFLQVGCTASGNLKLCPPRAWAITAPPAGDSTAPATPYDLSCEPGEDEVTCRWRATQDPYDGGPCSGVDEYEADFGGTVVPVSGIAGLCPQLTQTIVGATEGSPSSTQTGVNWALTFGGGGIDDATDHYLFRGAQVTGDFVLRFKVGTLSSGAAFAKEGITWVEDITDVGSKRCGVYYQLNGKLQGRCRTSTGAASATNLFNIAAAPGDCAELAKVGNNTVIRTTSDDECNGMQEQATVSNPSTATVWAGMFITSGSAGTSASGSLERFSLTNSPDLSHTFPTTSTVNVRVRAKDGVPNTSAYGGTVVVTPVVTVPTTGTYKWHPGHYLLSPNGTSHQGRKDQCTDIAARGSEWKGLHIRYLWNDLESDTGTYTFGNIADILNHCKGLGKRIVVEVWWRSFCNVSTNCPSPPSTLIPAYVQNLGGTNNGVYLTGDGWKAAVWRPEIMDRLIALYQALGDTFDSDTHFEVMQTGETAGGGGVTSVSDYSAAQFVAQYKRFITEVRPSWPNTLLRLSVNYVTGGSNAHMIDLINHSVANDVALGGPDICQQTNCPNTQAQFILLGQPHPTTGVLQGHDYRGEAVMASNVEPISYSHSMPTLYDRGIDDFELSHISWMQYSGWQSNAQAAVWDNGATLPEPDIVDFIDANPTTVATCPSSITCDTD